MTIIRQSFTPTTIRVLQSRKRVQNKQISIEHIEISFILVDPLTKGLIPKVFHKHTVHMELSSLDFTQGESLVGRIGDAYRTYSKRVQGHLC
ncbi:hypothetical protein CR513_24911, partial [Mucuna pruriens]